MGNYYRYDAHCHIFTLKYAIKEVKSLLHDILHGTYPWDDPNAKKLGSFKRSFSDLKELLRQLYELIHAAGGTEEENLEFLQKEAGTAFTPDELHIIPLMMDIFYMFAYPLNKDEEILSVKRLKATPVDEKEFQDNWNEILDDLSDYIQPQKKSLKATRNPNETKKVERTLKIIEEERAVKNIIESKNRKLKLI